LGFVAKRGESVIVTDVDGTLTSSENAVLKTVVANRDIGHQRDAPEILAKTGKPIVYLTARGDQFTEATRHWLQAHGFPKGPLRLARSFVTLPGASTSAYKASAMNHFGVPIAAGIGNRASDIAAYRELGLRPEQIFIKMPEFTSELEHRLAAGEATPFQSYSELDFASGAKRK
jgi:phosphatidate phosphatase PAH1